jgi:NodT family efflux transporter outer membrane factor (OMF) lipoprotein
LYNASVSASWVPDIWGKVRRQVESDVASAQASAADLASATLSAQATLAIDYFELRTNDATKRLLEETVDAFTLSLQITQNRYRAGTAAKTDVVQAQSQLEQTRAQLIALGVQRAQLEHAIAVLVGKPPADLSIAPAPLAMDIPDIPTVVPSVLLERRPDVASAERKMAAANAQIGVAIAAYYPDLTLSGTYGFSNTMLGQLLRTSSAIWAFGPQLAGTLLDFGARSAQVDFARAGFDLTVADYRQTVLASFQQVEDQLAALRILALQAQVQDTAVRLAEEAERLTLNQYKAGTVSYTNVITAQTTALADKQTALGVQQGRLVASVTLIEALGGGWSTAQLSDRE